MQKTIYEARREAVEFATLLNPADARQMLEYAKAIESYLIGEVISGEPSGLAASGRVELGNVD